MNLKYLILGILLVSLGFVYAETMPYWIEDYGDGYNLWVKIPYIPANGDTVVYVEKDSDYKPDGDKVFEFFDDFDGSELDRSKWGVAGSPSYYVSGGNLILSYAESPNYIYSKFLLPKNYIIETKYDNSDGDHDMRIGINLDISDSNYVQCLLPWEGGDSRIDPIKNGIWDGWHYKTGMPYLYGTNQRVTIKVTEDIIKSVIINNNQILTDLTVDRFGNYFCLTKDTDDTVYIDYIFVRKYADKEPTTTISKINNNLYKITIHNPNSYSLKDFQVKVPNPSFITSKFEGLKITDKNPLQSNASSTSTSTTSIKSKLATIYIESEPSDANVFINGEYKGITPLKLQLEEGTYNIKIKKDGYNEYVEKITLKPGDSKEISVGLAKEDNNNIILIISAVFGSLIVVGGGAYIINKRNKDKKKKEVMDELEDLLRR
ncbi:PEGA domain protein [Methanocaldococcus vulcanius M7]|uniref:PEGA domain protein n=1 Tax=Methanocaldococcus vulcanius (strain ATCC 700851 / DSM 12094 / M7) TaxID=579137 RepID=C9RGZ7_METVM|nr:DUF2341 domain-containing protein [Methanocaldococcus vulcanius]ACX72849.1 PEGA domain protein [Methanocaldococcus vulcanius M7]